MASLRLLDTTRAGRPGEDLGRKLHRTIVGQDEAIHHIVRAHQCCVTGLAAAGRRSQTYSSSDRQAPVRLGWLRQRFDSGISRIVRHTHC